MCIIMVKEQNVLFPEEKILENCWDNNPDMGGFMYAWQGQVHIRKGFLTFEDFKRALNKAREKTGDKVPYVLHFRISTQGYNKECCQPFPLSSKMHNLKKLKCASNIGVAHNGVLSLTSNGAKDYSDTMLFITDYLTNIVRGFDWYEDKRTKLLIENLISGSRFAIMDKNGHIERCGKGWVKDTVSGCHFSNSTYSYKKYVWKGNTTGSYLYSDDDWSYDYYGKSKGNYWQNWKSATTEKVVQTVKAVQTVNTVKTVNTATQAKQSRKEKKDDKKSGKDYYSKETGICNFDESNCPHTLYDEDVYCDRDICKNFHNCSYVKKCLGEACVKANERLDDIFREVDDDAYGLKSARA